jgi:hypothetical protein
MIFATLTDAAYCICVPLAMWGVLFSIYFAIDSGYDLMRGGR